MTYLNCPRCGLSVVERPSRATEAICPRCHGRAGLLVPMYATDRPRPPAEADAEPAPRAA